MDNVNATPATGGVGSPPKRRTIDLDEIFRYHPPDPGDRERFIQIRLAARELARVILDNTPVCADQTAAIRKVREAVMWANASVALKGLI